MKEITAVIRPHMSSKVMDALHALPHFPGITINDCQGQGRGEGAGGHFEATSENVFFTERLRLEMVCSDSAADGLVEIIQAAAHTGNPGDGIITVADLSSAVRIRTGQAQEGAV